MAIQKTITSKFGIDIDSAYIRVESISFTSKEKINFVAKFYANKDFNPFDVKSYSVDYVIDGSNPYIQAYEYLKTLPEFADATDV